MRCRELAGRKGKQPNGTAKTRQVYLGCVFTQHRTDEKGHPVRDHESTTYVSSFKSIDQFGPLLRQEAIRRGMGGAGQVVLLIDGAAGLEHMGQDCFHNSAQIVDFYHALEHAGEVLDALIGKNHPKRKARLRRWAKRLLKNQVAALIKETRQTSAGTPQAQAVAEALGYFENNVERMQYGSFRKNGYFIGSGVVEAGCKTIIGARCKQSGIFWCRPGAEKVLALRCIHSSRRLDEFWKHRLNHHAKRNDALSLSAWCRILSGTQLERRDDVIACAPGHFRQYFGVREPRDFCSLPRADVWIAHPPGTTVGAPVRERQKLSSV